MLELKVNTDSSSTGHMRSIFAFSSPKLRTIDKSFEDEATPSDQRINGSHQGETIRTSSPFDDKLRFRHGGRSQKGSRGFWTAESKLMILKGDQ